MRRIILALLALMATSSISLAQQPGPYDRTYTMRGGAEAPLYADMTTSAAKIGTLPGDASGIILRWCREELPFGSWQFGTLKQQEAILDKHWCEISWQGKIGNVEGSALTPE